MTLTCFNVFTQELIQWCTIHINSIIKQMLFSYYEVNCWLYWTPSWISLNVTSYVNFCWQSQKLSVTNILLVAWCVQGSHHPPWNGGHSYSPHSQFKIIVIISIANTFKWIFGCYLVYTVLVHHKNHQISKTKALLPFQLQWPLAIIKYTPSFHTFRWIIGCYIACTVSVHHKNHQKQRNQQN